MRQAVNMRQFAPDSDLVEIAAARPGASIKHDPSKIPVMIYTIPPSLCSQRVRMTLCEKGVRYSEHVMDMSRGENLEPDYIKLNPRALVPTMTFGSRVIFDSATIMCFANNYFSGPELMPTDAAAFERMHRWIRRSDDFPVRGFHYRSHLASGLPDYVRVAMRDNIIKACELYPEYRSLYDLKLADWEDLANWVASPADLAAGDRLAQELADDVERDLHHGNYLLGEQFSLADITVFILLIRLQCGCGAPLWGGTLRPALADYIERLKIRDSYDVAVLEPYRSSNLVAFSGDCWLPASAVQGEPSLQDL